MCELVLFFYILSVFFNGSNLIDYIPSACYGNSNTQMDGCAVFRNRQKPQTRPFFWLRNSRTVGCGRCNATLGKNVLSRGSPNEIPAAWKFPLSVHRLRRLIAFDRDWPSGGLCLDGRGAISLDGPCGTPFHPRPSANCSLPVTNPSISKSFESIRWLYVFFFGSSLETLPCANSAPIQLKGCTTSSAASQFR